MSIAIVMPVYNEERGLVKVVTDWLVVLSQLDAGYLVCVNDGSTDKSLEILRTLKQSNPELIIVDKKNAGHGQAIITGFYKALEYKTDYIFQTDSDNQIISTEFFKLWKLKTTGELILGFREHRDDPMIRKVVSKTLANLTSMLFKSRLKDLNVPFRLMTYQCLKDYLAALGEWKPFAPNVFLSLFVDSEKIKIISVSHRRRQSGQDSLNLMRLLTAVLLSFYELFKWKIIKSKDPESLS